MTYNIYIYRLLAAAGAILFFSCHSLSADNKNDSLSPVIDSIEIINENVFDTGEPQYNNFFFKLANSLHFITRPGVIRRELLISVGEKYDTALAHESERNLRSLPYFGQMVNRGPGIFSSKRAPGWFSIRLWREQSPRIRHFHDPWFLCPWRWS